MPVWITTHDVPKKEAEGKEKPEEFDLSFITKPQPVNLGELEKCTSFNRRELKVIYRSFKQGCPTGKVTLEEFKEIYSHIFPHGDSSSYAEYVFNSVDTGKKEINFEEFSKILSKLSRGSEVEKLCWIFRFYDVDCDGFITKSDVSKVLRSVYDLMGLQTDPPTDEFALKHHISDIFQRFDVDKEEMISLDRFISVCQRNPDLTRSLHVFDTHL